MTEAKQGSKTEPKAPERRCLCCQNSKAKRKLLRFVLLQGELCFDLRKKMPGRGYYCCPEELCLKKAFAGAFKRLLKRDSQGLASDHLQFIQSMLLPGLAKRCDELLLAGRQAKSLVLGADAVEEAAIQGKLLGYLLASDASAGCCEKYRQNAERKALYFAMGSERTHYGALFGAPDRVVLGWKKSELAEEFFELLEQRLRLERVLKTTT